MGMTSLSTLSVVINGSNLDEFWSCFLRNCLVENTSLSLLCVTVNYDVEDNNNNENDNDNDNDDDNENENDNDNDNDNDSVDSFRHSDDVEEPEYWYKGLANGLARTASLNELTLTIKDQILTRRCWIDSVCEGLAENETVTTLTVTVSNDHDFHLCEMWALFLNSGLAKNKSLTTLTLTMNLYSEGERLEGCNPSRFNIVYPGNTSLPTLNLTINICREATEDWLPNICHLLVNRSSLTTFRLNVNNHCATNESRIYDFSKLRLKCRSLSSFERTVTFYGE